MAFYQKLNQPSRAPAREPKSAAAQQAGLPTSGTRAPPVAAALLEALRRGKLDKLLLSAQELRDIGVPFSKTQLYAQIAAGAFPAPIRVSSQRVAWIASEVLRWLEQRMAERDDAVA